MNCDIIPNAAGILAILMGLSYAIGTWRMVRSPSRFMFVVLFLYLTAQKAVIAFAEADPDLFWIETHKSWTAAPMYVLLTVAVGMTYYELRSLHFTKRNPVHWKPDQDEIEDALHHDKESDDAA